MVGVVEHAFFLKLPVILMPMLLQQLLIVLVHNNQLHGLQLDLPPLLIGLLLVVVLLGGHLGGVPPHQALR